MSTSPAVRSIQRHARSAMNESMTIDERMGVYRTMINALMGEYTALRDLRDRLRFEAKTAADDAISIAKEERGR